MPKRYATFIAIGYITDKVWVYIKRRWRMKELKSYMFELTDKNGSTTKTNVTTDDIEAAKKIALRRCPDSVITKCTSKLINPGRSRLIDG